MCAAQASLYAELFETRFRFSGIALARESTAALIAGPAPFVATAIVGATGGAVRPIALLVSGLAAISFLAVLKAPETHNVDLRATDGDSRGPAPAGETVEETAR
ncbi:hypothetical protein GCM10010329_29970 [Streptomyces spiroverticillatus]|uniref:MFS transporter n=1 Tax=Streptomyces finlayi TaxID=67296 RepID=A0A919C987_9ACTN|nr:hypothetical protein [Streptomyces finlayi]GHA05526.1 hypothetical protein GCM10010329_29970 [Streptomyces spiroverticillatus]GHC89386.1 hypothetical protein GCM10010334_22380 [Streptomyces finlayi]